MIPDMQNPAQAALGGIEFNVTVLTTGFWPSYQARLGAAQAR